MHALYAVMLYLVSAQGNAVSSDSQDFTNWVRRGRAEYLAGRFTAAEPLFLAALRAVKPGDEGARATTLNELGDVYVNEDEIAKAESVYLESLNIFKRIGDKKQTAVVLRNLGAVYSIERRDSDAERLLKQGLKLLKEPEPALRAQVLNTIGIIYYRQGKNNKAEKLFNQALELVSGSESPFDIAELLHNLGAIQFAKHRYEAAEAFLQRALHLTEMAQGASHPNIVFTLTAIGNLYTNIGKYDEAEQQYQRAIKILEPIQSQFDTRIARILPYITIT